MSLFKKLSLLMFFFSNLIYSQEIDFSFLKSLPKSDVFIQGFYWNSTPGGIWYDSLAKLAPRLASAGFGAIWFPSPVKGMAGPYSMGYDPYDHYDFGEYNQKGSIETRFGSRQELINAINIYHRVGIEVWADAVMNHMNGGEQKLAYECKPYPSFPDSEYMLFNYPNGSGRFRKNASHFYPNLQTCDVNPPYHGDPVFQFGVWLAHDKQNVKDSLIVWGQYLRNVLGFDGFRLDAAKHMDPIFVGPWLQYANSGGYAVAEYYGGANEIATWLHYTQNVFGGDVSVFDFPLRFTLKDMCDNTSGSFDMNYLDGAGLVNFGISGFDVATFVDNHDFDRIGWDGSIDIGHSPIVNDKHMAYAYIIFSEGRPSVWFKDYFAYGLAGKIDTLIWIRQNYLWGTTTKRDGLNPWYVGAAIPQIDQSRDIYVARRNGGNGKPQAFIVINDNPNEWRGVWVNSNHPNQIFRDYTGVAIDKQAAADGRVELWAPPRGYAIYIPDTTKKINHPPFIQKIPDLKAYINSYFSYQVSYGDPNLDSVQISIINNPQWLSISNTGLLSGTPALADTGIVNLVVTATDHWGLSVSDTFNLIVFAHPVVDGLFDGEGVWGNPVAIADTLAGWAGAMAKNIYISEDQNYYYFGANVRAYQSMNWAFLINTKPGGSSSESWGRSIIYSHSNLPDFILRGNFSNYAEFHTWTGSFWSGVGSALNGSEFAESIISDTLSNGWVECRILKSALGNPQTIAVQFYITGNSNSNATFDACPNDENTTAWTGVITRLKYYAYRGTKQITFCNLQSPGSATIYQGQSAMVYSRAFGLGLTDTLGPTQGLSVWIGYNQSNTNPQSWINWTEMNYFQDINNHDEYRLNFGNNLNTGIYYYAVRYQYNGGEYLFGGYSTNGGGFWNGTTIVSGTLTILGPPVTPQLISPDPDATDISINTNFVWTISPSATYYNLQIALDTNFTSIIFEDSTITTNSRYVENLPSSKDLYWRVRAKNNYGLSQFSVIRRFTTKYEILKSVFTLSGWNMISVPVSSNNFYRMNLFPTSISSAFKYTQTGYTSVDTLETRIGYWLKFPSKDTIPILGTPILVDTFYVNQGWNMIGSISEDLSINNIIQVPENIIESNFYKYENGYSRSELIESGKSYWVKVNQTGILILNSQLKNQKQIKE